MTTPVGDKAAPVIETKGLSRLFGRHEAVRGLDLAVPRGSVFGFLGLNGAGKTTTIRMLLGLLRPTTGSASVLGMDPANDGVAIRQRVGYVAERQKMYDWMTVGETIGFVKSFYPTWKDALADDLLRRFGLDPKAKMGSLSVGMNAKVALLLALAHEPELLILDDPTSGLDVVVRREFLESIVQVIHEAGRTVFFSSHFVHELERVADWVAIIHEGRLVASQSLSAWRARTKRLRLIFDGQVPAQVSIPGMLSTHRHEHELVVTTQSFDDAALQSARATGASSIEVLDLSLEDIFVEVVGGQSHASVAVERMA